MLYIIIAVILIIVLATYNDLVKKQYKVKQAKQGIDVYLKQRFDLIPNLVECVKAYSKHEKEVLEKITVLRTDYMRNPTSLKDAENLNNKLNELTLIAENYPDLKASEQYLNLQKALTKMESQLQAARRIYNSEVTNYNCKIEKIPSNIIASLFGFKRADFFEVEESNKQNVNINIGE